MADRDIESHLFTWSVYHIENFLVEPQYVHAAHVALGGDSDSPETVYGLLRDCAEQVAEGLVTRSVQAEVNDRLVGAISIGGAPGDGAINWGHPCSGRSTGSRWSTGRCQQTDGYTSGRLS